MFMRRGADEEDVDPGPNGQTQQRPRVPPTGAFKPCPGIQSFNPRALKAVWKAKVLQVFDGANNDDNAIQAPGRTPGAT